MVTKLSKDPPLACFDPKFYMAFILRMIRTCGENSDAVMSSHVGVALIELYLPFFIGDNGSFEIIWDEDIGNTSVKVKCTVMAVDEIGSAL